MNYCINVQFVPFCFEFRVVAKLFQNAPKWKETYQNMSLGSNGVDRERSLQKILTRHRSRTFALIAQVWRFCTKFRAVAKRSKKHPNGKKHTKT